MRKIPRTAKLDASEGALRDIPKHRHARRARVIFLCEVSEIGAFMELFTVTIWLT